ncbi:major facilitator superfamily transporter [Hortaea werneckii]|nr:major facilitator superfamily transporter [Hortaea werneckii]
MSGDSIKEKDVEGSPQVQPTGEPEDIIGEVRDVKKADAALDFLRSEGNVRPMLPEDEKKLLRKIDWMVMPLMWCCYCLQYLDKTLINYANVMGLQEDANITEDQFSYLALIFYVTYLALEFPHAYGMQKLPTAKYFGVMVFLWGVIVTVTAACKNYGALIATRVLLGCFEAAVAPSLILITSMWYKAKEQPPRVGIWYLGVGTGTIIGSLISFGFQHYTDGTFTSWQIMFLVVGLVTCLVGGLTFLLLPDNPMRSRLTHEQKVWAIERLRSNQTGVENKHFKPAQVVECFLDPQTWLLSLITISSNVPNGAVSSFQATIISGFGFHIVTLLMAGILGGCLMAFAPEGNKAGKLIGNYFTNCIGATLPLLYSFVSANYAGHTKKVTMNAILLMSFCLGNIIGPLTFTGKSAPQYIPAKITIIVTCAVAAVLTIMLGFYYKWENKRRDHLAAEGKIAHVRDVEFSDVTDRHNKEFRYRL